MKLKSFDEYLKTRLSEEEGEVKIDYKSLPEEEKRKGFEDLCGITKYMGLEGQKTLEQFCIDWDIPYKWYKIEARFGMKEHDIVLAFVEDDRFTR